MQMYSLMKNKKTNTCVAMPQFKEPNITKTSGGSSEYLSNLMLFSAPPKNSYPKICVKYSLPSCFPFVCFSKQYFGNLQSV